MKRKDIDAAREVRLWIRDIIVPGVALTVAALAIPEVREAVKDKATKIKNKFKKEDS